MCVCVCVCVCVYHVLGHVALELRNCIELLESVGSSYSCQQGSAALGCSFWYIARDRDQLAYCMSCSDTGQILRCGSDTHIRMYIHTMGGPDCFMWQRIFQQKVQL